MGSTSRLRRERTITSEPQKGTVMPVEVATHVAGTLEFVSGAIVSIAMSFDVPAHRHTPIEIYGTKASMLVPDPNRFGGTVEIAPPRGAFTAVAPSHAYVDGEFRSIGVADMAAAIIAGRPHRASGALALHALEAMEAFQTSADQGRRVTLETTVERPAMMPADPATGRFD
jgi:hypothetical protein